MAAPAAPARSAQCGPDATLAQAPTLGERRRRANVDRQPISTVFGQPFRFSRRAASHRAADPARGATGGGRGFCLGSAGYLAVIGVAFASPLAALAPTGLIAIYYVVDRRRPRRERRPRRRAEGAGPPSQAAPPVVV